MINNHVVRNNFGLAIAGTRITIYDIMDYLKQEWPQHLIQDWLNLSNPQISEAIDYINNNYDQVQKEYENVLENNETIEQYWRKRTKKSRFPENLSLQKEMLKKELILRKLKKCHA
ncbi:MAG: hypothetical protein OMM_12838 [Candidatus Magnetoglobus multicellularis str. Araruama]|uniref:DUF433 domain-containing protein n=1 Tax=Candidatus Magnetoglobus multicellularis str. Araruama TaxID=890399 RepID=A0A1V1NV20_9BACT|nr:MAG: hypothetical protein OMM_12838 [Candidatus Magnetoglobus multicellularis str. Araruama]